MDAHPYHLDFPTILNALSAILMMVFGFLLHRVFQEIDALRQADTKLAEADSRLADAISNLRPNLIDRDAFDKHVDREERLMTNQQNAIEDVRRLVTELHVSLAAHIRLQAQQALSTNGLPRDV